MGYWAVRDPVRVFDFDGKVVARAGERVWLGGGHAGIEHVHVEDRCGAFGTWVGGPTTKPPGMKGPRAKPAH